MMRKPRMLALLMAALFASGCSILLVDGGSRTVTSPEAVECDPTPVWPGVDVSVAAASTVLFFMVGLTVMVSNEPARDTLPVLGGFVGTAGVSLGSGLYGVRKAQKCRNQHRLRGGGLPPDTPALSDDR